MKLREAVEGVEYKIKSFSIDDEELKSFLFSLGCYEGENITVINKISGGWIVVIKDARYCFDKRLRDVIEIE